MNQNNNQEETLNKIKKKISEIRNYVPKVGPMIQNNNQEETLNKIKKKISEIRNYVPKVGVFGNSGVGKSSLCNALFGRDVAEINDVEACTREPQEIFVSPNNNNNGIILVDVPGIGEDPERQIEYTNLYKSLTPELDLVLWAIKSDDRNYASAIDTYKTVFSCENSPPVVFVVTQTDKTNDSDDWDREEYKPGGTQIGNIARKENDISQRFNTPTSRICSISVQVKNGRLTGKSYNLPLLVDRIVDVLPPEKKYSFTREAEAENVSTESIMKAEKGIVDYIIDMLGSGASKFVNTVKDVVLESAPPIIKNMINKAKDFLANLFS